MSYCGKGITCEDAQELGFISTAITLLSLIFLHEVIRPKDRYSILYTDHLVDSILLYGWGILGFSSLAHETMGWSDYLVVCMAAAFLIVYYSLLMSDRRHQMAEFQSQEAFVPAAPLTTESLDS